MPTAILPKDPKRCWRSKANARLLLHLVSQGVPLRKCATHLNCSAEFLVNWLRSDPDLSSQYARAKESLAEHYAEEIIDISDSATVRDAHVARLKVDSRKWVAAKLMPKKYGDRPAEVNVNTQINLAAISVEDQQRLQARRQELLKEQGN